MEHKRGRAGILALLAFGVVAAAAIMANPAHAQTTSVGPYYARPSWDQTLQSATRFIILSNFASAAVLDRETGLVWERSPATATMPWGAATFNCIDKIVGGRKGWRLPAIAELMSLVDPSESGPALPAGHPFTTVLSAQYWSASIPPGASIVSSAWSVGLLRGDQAGVIDISAAHHVWCVRGSMQESVY
jgi:hypothetical protein